MTDEKNVSALSDTASVDESLVGGGVAPEIAEVLSGLPLEKRNVVISALKQESFSGPLPHPRLLKEYDEIQPGFAERIVAMAEREQAHRFACDDKVVGSAVASSKRGQWMGYSIAIIFGAIALTLGLLGHVAVASIIGGLDIVALVAVFVTNRPAKSDDK